MKNLWRVEARPGRFAEGARRKKAGPRRIGKREQEMRAREAPGHASGKEEKAGRQAARPLPADTPPEGEGVFAETAGLRPGGEEEPRVDAKRPT